ncbi:uncharacterized protein HMPREF1541_00317 [Cyphellophora europaea CBS 101466]|uniref:JmjC domain-containing protein n=1 Tax=Cyphellophora europaea (strain CBS 101466) TaxID=1220924 RepID=W2SDL9_CYPE1|nr:uncharacterized protein HMPREF1541_00317 [Cyphellophora europaea CBS 101466]ETN46133.1 hypothetical protein HMPREF1541_00317 [Cyphellophora europaea CBS 101466]
MASIKTTVIWAKDQLHTLQEDFHDFNPAAVKLLPRPSPLEFSKIVGKGQPSLLKIYTPHDVASSSPPWPACSWTRKDLESKVVDTVEVAVTPYGNADALVSVPDDESGPNQVKIFVQPAAVQLTITELFEELSPQTNPRDGPAPPVYYLQSQDSNLTTTPLSPLLSDLPQNFDFAVDILGEPDARNIWIGDERSVTSIHRDPYENLYLVLRGSKTFRLWPPVDEISMPTQKVRTGSYRFRQEGKVSRFEVDLDPDGEIPWVDHDPLSISSEEVGKMRIVTVQPGQMLYLPAGWYHHVSQECGTWDDGSFAPCIAINYWFDMDYEGEKFVMRQLMSRLVNLAKEMPADS